MLTGILNYGAVSDIAYGALSGFTGRLWDLRMNQFSITSEKGELVGQAFNKTTALLSTSDSAIISELFKLTIQFSSLDFDDIQRVLDQKAGVASSTRFPVYLARVVPATPFTVTIAALSAAAADLPMQITVANSTGPAVPLTQIANAAVLATGQFKVASAGAIVFHSTQEAANVSIVYYTDITSVPVIGGATALASFGEMQFFGTMRGTRGNSQIVIPRAVLAADSTGTISVDGSVVENTLTYNLLDFPSWSKPFAIRQV